MSNRPAIIYKVEDNLQIREFSTDLDVQVEKDGDICIDVDENDSGYTHDRHARIWLSPESQRALRDFLNEVVKHD